MGNDVVQARQHEAPPVFETLLTNVGDCSLLTTVDTTFPVRTNGPQFGRTTPLGPHQTLGTRDTRSGY